MCINVLNIKKVPFWWVDRQWESSQRQVKTVAANMYSLQPLYYNDECAKAFLSFIFSWALCNPSPVGININQLKEILILRYFWPSEWKNTFSHLVANRQIDTRGSMQKAFSKKLLCSFVLFGTQILCIIFLDIFKNPCKEDTPSLVILCVLVKAFLSQRRSSFLFFLFLFLLFRPLLLLLSPAGGGHFAFENDDGLKNYWAIEE